MSRASLHLIILLCLAATVLCFPSSIRAQESDGSTISTDQFDQSAVSSSQDNQGGDSNSQDQTSNAASTTQKTSEVKLPSFSYKDTKETLLGRSLVLSIGLFPFTYFYSGFVLDVTRFIAHDFSASYAPWPFKTQYSVALTDSEMWIKLGIASASCLVFGFLGAILK